MDPLRIHLFGGFLLERGGVALPPIASRAGRSLLAYLVMHRGRPIQRDLLAGSFWPELPEGRARRRLSHTLWQIQDVVSEGAVSHLQVTVDTLTFDANTPYWLDVEEFDRLFELSQAARSHPDPRSGFDGSALRACVELYRGDFMAGFFDDWVVVDQDHYRQRYLVALGRLVDVTKGEGGYEDALAYARRLTHHDPLNEEAHQEVMRLCFLLGRTTEAVQQYERLRSVLAEELDTEPSPATVELYRRILRRRRSGIRPLSGDERASLLGGRPEAPFVGREEERRRIVDHLERVLAGPGGVVLVEGEPGVGKSRLAVEAADDAKWRGFEVSWGACAPGALRPFAPLVDVLETLSPLRVEQLAEQVPGVWLAEAVRLAPALQERIPEGAVAAPLRPSEESTRMRESLVHILGALGDIAPHVIIVDDVHWADRDTLAVLTQLGNRLASTRILLLLLYRSEEARGDAEVWDVLRELDRSAGLGRVVLSPMSVFELGDMVKRVLGLSRLDPSVASGLHRHTGGNVLFALETLLSLRDRGMFETGDPATVLEYQLSRHTAPVAPRVRSVIDARISLLDDDVSTMFQIAAVSGEPSDLDLLASVAELPRRQVLDAVDELLHRGLIRDEGDGLYGLSHDQVRQVVYEGMTEERRSALHRRLGETLAQSRPSDVEAIGHHLRLGGVPGAAAAYLLEAGRRAVGLNAYATARQHLERAREEASRAGWADRDMYRLLAELEDVLDVLGLRPAQEQVIADMEPLVGGDRGLEGDLARRRAWLLAHTGHFAEAIEAAESSVEVERGRHDGAGLSASLVALGTCLRWSGRPLDAIPHLEEAVEAAAEHELGRAEALTELASTLVEVQRTTEALPRLDAALAVYGALRDRRGEAEILGIKARAMRHLGDRDESEALYIAAITLCRDIGYRHGEGVNLVNLANLHYLTHRVGDALSGYQEAALVFAGLGNLRGEAMALANASSVRHSFIGDDERARREAERALDIFSDIGDRARQAQVSEVLAMIAHRAGRNSEATSTMTASLSELQGTGHRSLEAQHLRSLASLQIDARDCEAALETITRASLVCSDAGLDELAVEIESLRAIALLEVGYSDQAVDAARASVAAVGPGVERPYLIHYRHALVANAMALHTEAREAALLARGLLEEELAGLPDDLRRSAIERVPEHRAILDMVARFSPLRQEVWLPARDTPVGRPLLNEELVAVRWTLEDPQDASAAGPIDLRRMRLLRLLREAEAAGACPAIEHLADALGVSDSTVRRDLSHLQDEGHDIVTRGRRRGAS